MNILFRLLYAVVSKQRLSNCCSAALYLCCLGNTVHAESDPNTSFASSGTGWRLHTAGHYQPLSAETLATLIAEHPSFCDPLRPDGRPLQWEDATGQARPWQFSNEGGVLRWQSGASQQQLIWAEGSGKELPIESVSNQLAMLVTPTSPKRLTVVWPEFSFQRYSAVDVTDPLQPKALWQWQAPMAGSVQTPVASFVKTASGASHAFVMVSGADAVQPAFWLVDAASGKQIASQQYQRSVKTVELPFVLKDLVAAPAVLDRNADGYTDRIYLVDIQGRLVQADLDPQLKFQSRVVADLTDSAAQFDVQMVVSRALLPDEQLFTTTAPELSVADDEPPISTLDKAAGVSGQPADVVILISKKNKQSQLWVLIIPDPPAYTIQPHHLTMRDLQSDDLTAIQATKAMAGWYGTLPEAPVLLPQVLAGVLYLPVAPGAPNCAGARQATRLVARHLFQGSPVYTAEQLAAIPKPFGLPVAVRRSPGVLALQDLQQGTILLPQILGIRSDCRFCTEELQQTNIPTWRRMAIYQHESEVYR